jgi:cyclopropane-fatty-acyl-phospholipid synthase
MAVEEGLVIAALLERGLLPDAIVRAGIRRIVAGRLQEQQAGGPAAQAERARRLAVALRGAPIAVATADANAQHYELPSTLFAHVLGPRLKYSCGWWPEGVRSLAAAEERMLALTLERADVQDGHSILDLGCGWGALTLYLAAACPRSQVLAVSNSHSQGEFVRARAREQDLTNVTVLTADVNTFAPGRTFDRIVSVEMLEHIRNHAALFRRVRGWLVRDGCFFVHVFAHRRFAYLFEARGPTDWMARHFFTGGMMPSDDWLIRCQDELSLDAHWRLGGEHYQRTAEAWLRNFDNHRDAIDDVLMVTYGADAVRLWRARWRVFFMACAEMFGHGAGTEWGVSQYRFKNGSL